MTTEESLALAVSELIKQKSSEERMELMRHIGWQELEEWKPTPETLSDQELMANLRKGLRYEEKGNVAEAT